MRHGLVTASISVKRSRAELFVEAADEGHETGGDALLWAVSELGANVLEERGGDDDM